MVYLLHTNVPIGFVAFCVTYFYQTSNANPNATGYAWLVGLATLFLYNSQRLFKAIYSKQSSPVLDWMKRFKGPLIFFSIGLFICSMYFFLKLIRIEIGPIICISSAAFLGVWYVYPVFKKPLREISGIKAFVVACVWLLVVVLFPMINEGVCHGLSIIKLMSYYIFFLGLAIPFDIRDLKYDSIQLKTIPQLVGINWAKWCCVLCVTVFWLLTCSTNLFDSMYVIVTLALIGLILGIRKNSADWYFVLIDLTIIPMVWFATQAHVG